MWSRSCLEMELARDLMHQQLLPPKALLISLSKPNKTAGQEPYVHPLSAKPPFNLSLEMCTESLGTETGTGIDQFSQELHITTRHQATKKAKHGARNFNFPPPLTSISGLQVQAHREGGRLVMKAFSFSSTARIFQAERGEGRLRLSLLKQGGGGGEEDQEENVKEEGGRIWSTTTSSSSSRCNGESSSNSRSKRIQTLTFCVVGV